MPCAPPPPQLKQVKRSASDFDAAAAFSVQSTSELRMDMLANILREHSRHMGGQLANSSNKDIARLAARDMGQHREAAVRTESGKRARQDRVMEVYDDNGKVRSQEAGPPCVEVVEAKYLWIAPVALSSVAVIPTAVLRILYGSVA